MRAFCIAAVTIVWIVVMTASVRYGFLNRCVAGSGGKQPGLDFFQVPCGFQNLLAGNNIFLTEISPYSAIATPYYNHPLLAVAVGFWTLPLPPDAAFWTFFAFSIALLALCAWLLSRLFSTASLRAFAFFAMFCTLPTYYLLWSGQMHLFVVASVAMVGYGLMRLSAERTTRWDIVILQTGVLLSLWSKPVALLFLPVLLLLPETRKSTFVSVILYAATSLLFLMVPRLNPGGYNAIHWSNLFQASLSPSHTFRLLTPYRLDYSHSFIAYSLPRLLYDYWPLQTIKYLTLLHQAVIAAFSLLVLAVPNKKERLHLAIGVVLLCVVSHFLCYFITLEYQFAALAPVVVILAWMLRQGRGPRWLLIAALVGASSIFLPTLQGLSQHDPDKYWQINACIRILPLEMAFIALAAYCFEIVRRERDFSKVRSQIAQAWMPIAVTALMLVTVFDVAYTTVPIRFLAPPDCWTKADWAEHFEDIVSRPGVRPEAVYLLHRELAFVYAKTNLTEAIHHFELARAIAARPDALTVEVADVFITANRREAAQKLLATLSTDKIQQANVKKRYLELEKMLNH